MASNWLFLWVSVYIKKAFNSFKGSWRKTARHVFTWRNLHVPKFRFDMKVNYSVQANSRRDISNLALHICLLLLFLLLVPLYFVWNPTLVPSPCAPRQWSMLKHKAWEWSWQNGTIAFREDNQVIFYFFGTVHDDFDVALLSWLCVCFGFYVHFDWHENRLICVNVWAHTRRSILKSRAVVDAVTCEWDLLWTTAYIQEVNVNI